VIFLLVQARQTTTAGPACNQISESEFGI